MDWINPALHPDHPAILVWQAHLDAGRLGSNPPPDPAVRANLLATDAIFRARARERHS